MNNKYMGTDNHGNPKSDYITTLQKMSEAKLYQRTKDMIWLSAYANNNSRSDYHWQCDACYDEWKSRNKAILYDKAWHEVVDNL